ILAELEKASEKERYNRHGIYFYVGDAYYRFHDYERAIPCLKAALHDNPTLYFPDRSDLQARNLLGEYYAQINELDSSDYYYRSMYDNRESVRFRPTYDVRAAAGIAYNLMKRGNYRQALSLLERWLPEAIDQKIYMEAYNITLALAECYLAENRSAQAKTMTDSAFTLIRHDRHNRFRRERLYEAIYHYGTATGNLSLARQYADSMQTAAAEYEKKTSSLIILRAEQEVFESEKALKDNQIKVHRMRFMLTFGGCILLLIFLGIGIYYNRVITRKNRGLYRQIKEQDSLNEEMERMTKRYENLLTSVSPSLEADAEKECPGDKQQKELVKRLSKYLLDGKNFNKPDIDLDGLVSELATNRSYLFEAVKTVTGKTLMECIQTLRLNEARQLIDNHPNLTIEAIAADCGFNNRQTFHRLFKEQYNISPAEYRKMVKNR
ncbi:MAG: helix-turn-helix domain-containing protein, partial [Dysgonamonadaceae bacterium]|nr:helix-turn-helix domain-containing protein [Dysgonamonadaceae bacterium]